MHYGYGVKSYGVKSKDCQKEYKGIVFKYGADWEEDEPILHVLAFKGKSIYRDWIQRDIYKNKEIQKAFTLQELHNIWDTDLLQHEPIVKVMEQIIENIKKDIDRAEEKICEYCHKEKWHCECTVSACPICGKFEITSTRFVNHICNPVWKCYFPARGYFKNIYGKNLDHVAEKFASYVDQKFDLQTTYRTLKEGEKRELIVLVYDQDDNPHSFVVSVKAGYNTFIWSTTGNFQTHGNQEPIYN